MKEKQSYLYAGKNPENSFTFWLSKIEEDTVIIITDKDTPEMNVFKVKRKDLQKDFNDNRIRELNWD